MENYTQPKKQPIIDISIRKIYDIKFKMGNEMKKIHMDESIPFKSLYFLRGYKLFHIELKTKKIYECEFTKGMEIIYINSNSNNDSIICLLKTGKLILIEHENKLKTFSNINLAGLLKKNQKKEYILDNFNVFINNTLDKIVICIDQFIMIWYQNNFNTLTNTGTFYNIVKENELKLINLEKEKKKNNFFINDGITVLFSNNFFYGSYTRIFYVIIVTEIGSKKTKIYIFDYLYLFNYNDKFRSLPPKFLIDYFNDLYNTEEVEDLKDIKTKISFSYINLDEKEAKNLCKPKLLLKCNKHGNILAIIINSENLKNITIIFFMTETYKFTSNKLYNLIGNKLNNQIIVDLNWICNDMFLMLLFKNGVFMIININFQVIILTDTTNSVLPDDYFYTPMYYNINKLKVNDNVKLITSKQREDIFLIYSNVYAICFQINYKTYETRLIYSEIPQDNFNDFLFELKFLQLYLSNVDLELNTEDNLTMQVLDIIHKHMTSLMKTSGLTVDSLNSLNEFSNNNKNNNTESYIKTESGIEIITKENDNKIKEKNKKKESTFGKTETVNTLIKSFIKYIRIFLSIQQNHETNITFLTYLIGRSYDFFIHLINHHEIFLAALFIELCEKYLCYDMQINNNENEIVIKNKNLSEFIFNPINIKNISFYSYNFINHKLLLSKMRLILIFFCLIEFRNNFALNINVLYFILAKLICQKLKVNNLLDDVLNITKIIIKNYKYLKQENEKIGKDEYVLNSISISLRNEIFSNLQISKIERQDIELDFFSEFYSIEDFSIFNETSENYCFNDEIGLIRDYNYLNNIGILQKWCIYFTNYLYAELFEDIKLYLDNHLMQSSIKTESNISPDELNLGRLIYFNINFFLQNISFFLKNFIVYMTSKNDSYQTDYNLYSYSSKQILDNYNKIFFSFLSPIEIPLLIFEFYVNETSPKKMTLPSEINQNLFKLITERSKYYNFTMDDAINFIEFLIKNGFSFENEKVDENYIYEIPINKRIQNYIFSSFLFFIFTAHKLNLIYILENEIELILNVIDCFSYKARREIIEYLFIIANGTLKYYLKIEFNQKINFNEEKYLEIILTFIKTIYYKILREEPFEIRKNISEFLQITPSAMKSYLLEGTIFYEYKNFNNLIKDKLFSFKDYVDINNFEIKYEIGGNIFETLINQKDKKNNKIIFKLFDKDKNLIKGFLTIIKNLINIIALPLTNINNKNNNLNNSGNKNKNKFPDKNKKLIFDLEADKDYIQKLIWNSLENPLKDNNNNINNQNNIINNNQENIDNNNKEEEKIDFTSIIFSTVDKIIKGNFDNKNIFQYSSTVLKSKLVRSIKIVIVKILHLFYLLDLKLKLLNCNGFEKTYEYLKYISISIYYENNYYHAYETLIKLVDFISMINFANIEDEKDKNNIFEILENIHLCSLKYKLNDYILEKLSIIQKNLAKDNIEIYENYSSFIKEDFNKMEKVYNNIKFLKSKNLKNFILNSLNIKYLNEISNIYRQLIQYCISLNLKDKIPLQNIRKKYIKLSESYYNLTGIPTNSFIEFKKNWQLIENEQLYKAIVSDNIESNDSTKNEKSNLVMNRRQRIGAETPKRKRKYSISNNKDEIIKEEEDKIINKQRKREESIEIREEKKISKIKTKNKVPKFVSNIKTYSSISTNSSGSNVNKDNKYIKFSKIIKIIIFNRIKNYYNKNKKALLNNNQKGEYKLYKIGEKHEKDGESPKKLVEVIVLKEKLNKKIEDEKDNGTTGIFGDIKPLDIINLSKKKANKIESIKRFVNKTDSNDIKNNYPKGISITNKLDELSEKLSKYENMVQNLGKDYSSQITYTNPSQK